MRDDTKPKKPSRWRGRLGWTLFVLGLLERIIGWGGSLDFLISRSADPGWVGKVVNFVVAQSAYLGFAFIIVGVVLILLAERRRTERLLEARLGPASPTPAAGTPSSEEQVRRIVEHVGDHYQTLAMAIGREDRLASDMAIAQCEAFLIELSRRNDIPIPDLRTGGSQAGALRVLAFYNEILPALQLNDDEEARRRAKAIVPKLNGKSEEQLRTDMDIPRIFAREQTAPIRVPSPPPVGPTPEPVKPLTKVPFYEYPKAVLQVLNPKVTKEASSNGRIRKVDGHLVLKNDSYIDLKHCKVMIVSLAVDGVSETIMEPLDAGGTLLGSGLGHFEIVKGHFKQICLITRDLIDVVSKPPFLLNITPIRRPLKDSSEYQLRLELRSEYEFPTVVDVIIHTGVEANLKITLQDQFVGTR